MSIKVANRWQGGKPNDRKEMWTAFPPAFPHLTSSIEETRCLGQRGVRERRQITKRDRPISRKANVFMQDSDSESHTFIGNLEGTSK